MQDSCLNYLFCHAFIPYIIVKLNVISAAKEDYYYVNHCAILAYNYVT